MAQTVVITGASAGIGRAAARLFAERGDRVGLIERGRTGLSGVADEVRQAGGTALPVEADLADYEQVEAAAEQIEDVLGPADVWVNSGFSSVFAPLSEIRPDELRAVMKVSYLGFVHGTMVALSLMRARDYGVIVQVALGEPGFPPQSAYCVARHAICGFTSSLRCELRHERSGVHVTLVQAAVASTPQFSWVRSRLPSSPQPVPPIYQREVAARGILYAADHPGRKQHWAGGTTAGALIANRLAPALLDRYLARTGYDGQRAHVPATGRPDNLCIPADGPAGHEHGATGDFDDRSHDRSPQKWMSQHAPHLVTAGAAAIIAGGVVAATAGWRR